MGNFVSTLIEDTSRTVQDFFASQGIFDDSEGGSIDGEDNTIIVPPDEPTDDPPIENDLLAAELLAAANGAANSDGLQSPFNVYGSLVRPTTDPTGPTTPSDPKNDPGSSEDGTGDSTSSTQRSNKKKNKFSYPHPLVGLLPVKKK